MYSKSLITKTGKILCTFTMPAASSLRRGNFVQLIRSYLLMTWCSREPGHRQGCNSEITYPYTCKVENEDTVGAAPAGDAPTTSEWSTILLPIKVRLILDAWRHLWVVVRRRNMTVDWGKSVAHFVFWRVNALLSGNVTRTLLLLVQVIAY